MKPSLFIAPELREKRRLAGRIGGRATFNKYGRAGMSGRGRKGGRPRLPALEELEQQDALAAKNNLKEAAARPFSFNQRKAGGISC